jgi:transcriptional/translational regulatory protein YebC/TACO1
MFHKRGVITVDKGKADEERLMEIALDAGADDVTDSGDVFEIVAAPERFEAAKAALEARGITAASAEVAMVPQSTVSVTGKDAEHAMKLLEELDDRDDVQSVASNVDIPQEELERLSA